VEAKTGGAVPPDGGFIRLLSFILKECIWLVSSCTFSAARSNKWRTHDDGSLDHFADLAKFFLLKTPVVLHHYEQPPSTVTDTLDG
jgi:hypothetical protein